MAGLKNEYTHNFRTSMSKVKAVFEPYPDPKNSPLGPKKPKMTPKLSQNQMLELKVT